MSEQPTDHQDPTDSSQLPEAFTHGDVPDALKQQVETIMDLDQLLDSARLVERTETVCVAGDLLQAYDQRIQEMAGLVDAEGNLREQEDASLADAARVEELHREVDDIRGQMDAKSMLVKFRAMPSDEWEKFDQAHRHSGGERSAEEPDPVRARPHRRVPHRDPLPQGGRREGHRRRMTAAEVEAKLRKRLTQGQFVKLYNAAYFCNTADGVDVPKLPSFWGAQKQAEPSVSSS
jgi:hypothetical protein